MSMNLDNLTALKTQARSPVFSMVKFTHSKVPDSILHKLTGDIQNNTNRW